MGIRLDWEIDSERDRIRGIGEDPDARRARRIAFLRLLFTLGVFLFLAVCFIAFAVYRLQEADREVETLLRDTVAAEVAALRIGDWSSYRKIQRSASPDWEVTQRQLFEEYQTLIQRNENVRLTGQILDIEIDDPRARVEVQEIVDGVPYTRTWFYWRYQVDEDGDGELDGWRHVNPDYTFWGDPQVYSGEAVTVHYNTVDDELATLMGRRFDEWITIGCSAISCESFPKITIQIMPDHVPDGLSWSLTDEWTLLVRSPYATRARSDLPFSPEMQIEAASLLAERLMVFGSGGLRGVYPADAEYLQQQVVSWLVGRFVLINTNTFLINSLINGYGETSIGQLLRVMQPNDSIAVLSQVTNLPLDQSNLDWRDFFTWRLVLEDVLAQQGQQDTFLTLYDTRQEGILAIARARYQQGPVDDPVVTDVLPTEAGPNGETQLLATLQYSGQDGTTRQDSALFRLVNNIWLRAS